MFFSKAILAKVSLKNRGKERKLKLPMWISYILRLLFSCLFSNLLCLNAAWYNRKKKNYYRDIMQIPRFKKEEKYSNSNQSKLFYFLYRGIFYSK